MGFRRAAALALVVGNAGCGPEIPFTWEIVDVLDLGMQVEVEELGPLGDPGDPMGRSFHEAMPLDRVRASIMVADTTGPVPDEELSFAWYVCPGTSCTTDTPDEPCDPEALRYTNECTLGTHDVARFSFADIETEEEAIALASSPITLRAIGGRARDGGPEACLDRLERDADLGPCMIVENYYALGSIGELVELAESRGLEVPTDIVPETTRQFPRNRVPAIDELMVQNGTGPSEAVQPGGRVQARVGDTLVITWTPTDADRDEATIVGSDGTTLEYTEPLSVSWWTTQRAAEFDFVPSVPRVRWDVGPDRGTFWLYVVATDGSQANGWASIAVEVTR